MIENAIGHPETVKANNRMDKQKHEEVFIIVQAYTRVYPYTMVIKFLATLVTEAAMFRASWFGNLTSLAPIDRAEQDVIAVIPFHGTFKVRPLCILTQVTWIRETCLIVAPIACSDQWDRNVFVHFATVSIW